MASSETIAQAQQFQDLLVAWMSTHPAATGLLLAAFCHKSYEILIFVVAVVLLANGVL